MKKAPKQMIGARVPAAWARKIEEICQATGKNQTQILHEALAQYLGEDVQNVGDELLDIKNRLAAVEARLTKMTSSLIG